MKPRPLIIQADGEIRTLSAADMKLFKPAKEVLPQELHKELLAMNKAAKDMSRLGKPKP
jgi:ribosomal protein S20